MPTSFIFQDEYIHPFNDIIHHRSIRFVFKSYHLSNAKKKKGYSNKIKEKINGENLHGENYGSIRGSNLRDQIYYIRDIINFIRRGYILISERLDHELYAMINADACITRVYVVGM